MILAEADSAGATRVGGELVARIGRRMDSSGEVTASPSIGIALYEARMVRAKEDLIAGADEAMYEAKRAGGDRYVLKSSTGASL